MKLRTEANPRQPINYRQLAGRLGNLIAKAIFKARSETKGSGKPAQKGRDEPVPGE